MTLVQGTDLERSRERSSDDSGSRALASWVLLALLAFAILAPLMTVDTSSTAGQGNLARQVFYLLVFCVALTGPINRKIPASIWLPPASVLVMLVWCGLSLLWAVDPGVAVRRLFLTVMIILSIFLLVERSGYQWAVLSVRYLLPVLLIANYFAVVAFPGWAIHQAATSDDPSIVGAWRGIMVQKNFAGAACAYTVMFFVLDAKGVHRYIRTATILGATLFLYETHSKTSLGFLLASLLLGAMFTRYNPRYRVIALIFLFLGLMITATLAYVNWASITAPFSDQDFLTGRVQIWPILINYWKDHWLLGSGYGSFWNIKGQQPIYHYTNGWISTITSGHNGYIDILVQTGLPGLVFAINATLVAPLRTLLTSLSIDRSRGALLLACIWFSICHNLTESSIFDRDATVQVFLMLAIALLTMEVRPRTATPRSADLRAKSR